MTQNFAGAGAFIVQMFFGIYILLIVLRFLMQVSGANYYNPLCQAVVKITGPAIRPFQNFLPAVKGVDTATLIVAIIIQLIALMLIMLFAGGDIFLFRYILWSALGVVSLILDIYFFSLLIMVIASWIAPYSTHPALQLINQLSEPLCASVRKFLPAMGGIDFSPILVFIVIRLIDKYLIVEPLAIMLGIPKGIMLGL